VQSSCVKLGKIAQPTRVCALWVADMNDGRSVMNKVLLIDDDVELTMLLQEYLVEEGYDVATGTDGGTAVAAAARNSVDLIVLDIMMPRTNGIEVLQRIRKLSQVPVLMLTARGDDIDRIRLSAKH